MVDALHDRTVCGLAAMLRATLGLGAAIGAGSCGDELGPNCPQTARDAHRVCYDSPADASGSVGTSADDTAGSGETSATDGTSTTSGGVVGSTGGDGPCAAFQNGPPDMPEGTWVGPYHENGQCCFTLDEQTSTSAADDGIGTGGDESVCGRPFRIGDETRVAPEAARRDWCDAIEPDVLRIDGATRRALAEAWLADAAAEHASVASFARFALDLLAVGAPPDLLVQTQRAVGDEIVHARACYGLASAYAGRALGPGPLATHDGSRDPIDLARMAAAAVREGCVGETLAAVQAAVAARRAEDPIVRAVLERIADDEARHAELAWRFVQWAIGRGDRDVREAVRRAFATNLPRPSRGGADLSRHGQLGERERLELYRHALDALVHPLARALLTTERVRTCEGRTDHRAGDTPAWPSIASRGTSSRPRPRCAS